MYHKLNGYGISPGRCNPGKTGIYIRFKFIYKIIQIKENPFPRKYFSRTFPNVLGILFPLIFRKIRILMFRTGHKFVHLNINHGVLGFSTEVN